MRLIAAVGFVALWTGIAAAHGQSLSYSRWELADHGARVELWMPMLELTRLPPAESPARYVAEKLRLLVGDDPCVPDAEPATMAGADGWALFRWAVVCRGAGTRAIRSELMSGMVSSHVHFARVSLQSGDVRERFLLEADPLWRVEGPGATSSIDSAMDVPRYLVLGAKHIVTGWDHLAFLVALLLLATSLREVATLITGFTIAHSLTLGLSALGVVFAEPAAVEALIGFSIALVATENLWLMGARDPLIPGLWAGLFLVALVWLRTVPVYAWVGLGVFSLCHFGLLTRDAGLGRVRAGVAFAFGLVHGFGFAGVLTQAELPTRRLVPALFGFNVGIELGQLLVVALIWPILTLLARRGGHWHRLLVESGSVATLAVGIYCVVIGAWG